MFDRTVISKDSNTKWIIEKEVLRNQVKEIEEWRWKEVERMNSILDWPEVKMWFKNLKPCWSQRSSNKTYWYKKNYFQKLFVVIWAYYYIFPFYDLKYFSWNYCYI